MNVCRGCGEDFASVAAFDRHRVGRHAYTLQEGLRMDPPVEDGRRCLHRSELESVTDEQGRRLFRRDGRGRWQLAVSAERARAAFHGPAVSVLAVLLVLVAAGTAEAGVVRPDLDEGGRRLELVCSQPRPVVCALLPAPGTKPRRLPLAALPVGPPVPCPSARWNIPAGRAVHWVRRGVDKGWWVCTRFGWRPA